MVYIGGIWVSPTYWQVLGVSKYSKIANMCKYPTILSRRIAMKVGPCRPFFSFYFEFNVDVDVDIPVDVFPCTVVQVSKEP